MELIEPGSFRATVLANWPKTLGLVLASSGECTEIQRQEVERVSGRKILAVRPEELQDAKLPRSWILAIILCPGDSLASLLAWVESLPLVDRARLRFYAHVKTNLDDGLREWRSAGFSEPPISIVTDFATFHKRFGVQLNRQIYLDHAGQ